MLTRLLRIYGIVLRRFGFTLRPLFTFCLIVAYRLFGLVTLALDGVFFPALRRLEPKPPVFIVGNPRSGTTFLHRFLVQNGVGAGFQLWQLIFPSLTARVVLEPLVGLLERVSPARFHGTKAHPTSLTSVETDDVLVFFRYLDGLFLWGYFWAWDDDAHLDELDENGRLGRTAARDFAFHRAAIRRNLLWHRQDRAIGKIFSAGLRLESFLKAWPEAKVLYMVRDPVEVIPSGMSLIMGVLEKAYPMHRIDAADRQRYLDRLYMASIELYRRVADLYAAGRLPADRVMIVRYDEMMADFEGMMDRICTFVGEPPSAELLETVKKTAAKQRAWKSEHSYDLDKFGLDADRIRQDCAFVYETFGIPGGAAKTA